MRVVAVLSQKGGAGKTTLACALAVAAREAGEVPVLIDLDPQASAASWSDRRADRSIVVQTAPTPRLGHVLSAARAGDATCAVLDTPPSHADTMLAAARAADFLLVPCRASYADIEAARDTHALLSVVRTPLAVVRNAVPVVGSWREDSLDALVGFQLPVLSCVVHQRIAHVRSFLSGQTALETHPESKAARELRELWRLVWTMRPPQGTRRRK